MSDRALTTSGYTLLELVLVLAIIAITVAAVAPSLSGFATGRKTEEAAAQFVSLTHFARTQAISDGCVYRIAIDVAAGRWFLQVESGDGFAELDSPYGRTFTVPENVQIETDASISDGLHVINFDASGRSDLATVKFVGPRGTVEVVCDAPIDEYHILREQEVR